MKREEAIIRFEKQLKAAQVVLDSGFGSNPGESDRLYRERKEMAEIAIAALRGPTREQAEAWPGCSYCQEGAYSDAAFDVMCRGEEADFCKFCGRPMTDKAVDVVMQRLEELYETE